MMHEQGGAIAIVDDVIDHLGDVVEGSSPGEFDASTDAVVRPPLQRPPELDAHEQGVGVHAQGDDDEEQHGRPGELRHFSPCPA